MAKKNYLTYKKKFKKIINDKTEIYNRDGQILEIQKDEKWIQCYDPKDPVRKEFPKYIFVSNKGNIVNVYHKDPVWMKPNILPNTEGRESYKFSDQKPRMGYAIVAVCFGSKIFGKARELLSQKGMNAFGKAKLDDLQVHHDIGYDEGKGRAYNNDPEHLTILTINVHDLFSKIPSKEASRKEQKKFMQEFACKCQEEEPEKIVILVPGDEKRKGTIETVEKASYISGQVISQDRECQEDFERHKEELYNMAVTAYQMDKTTQFETELKTESGKKYSVICQLHI